MDALIEKYVSANPEICHGKPCFRGTRIPVYLVLELLGASVTPQAITGPDYYPQLTHEHIRAALHFAAQYAKQLEYLPFEPAA